MSNKLLIEFNEKSLTNMIRHAFSLNPNFSRRPNYLIRPNEDSTWSIVGLGDSTGGPNYYPSTICPNCGETELIRVSANEEKQLYEVNCDHCDAFCNYFAVYTPLTEAIDAIVKKALV